MSDESQERTPLAAADAADETIQDAAVVTPLAMEESEHNSAPSTEAGAEDAEQNQARVTSHNATKSEHNSARVTAHLAVAGQNQNSLFSLLLLAMGVLTGVLLKLFLHKPSAYDELRSFAVSQSESLKMESIAELAVDDLNSFAQSTCVEGRRADDVRAALRRNLRITPEIRDNIIESAVIDGISTSSSVSNTSSELASHGKAVSYLAFWSTVFTEQPLGGEWYSSCVMASGITILAGEQVAEWQTTEVPQVKGFRPCECGLFRCERCPIIVTHKTRTPIFKRNQLTLKNQVDLRKRDCRVAYIVSANSSPYSFY